VPQPARHEIHKIPDFLNVAPVILAGKIDFIVYKFVTTQTGGNITFNLGFS
jgi:hypothetical protein